MKRSPAPAAWQAPEAAPSPAAASFCSFLRSQRGITLDSMGASRDMRLSISTISAARFGTAGVSTDLDRGVALMVVVGGGKGRKKEGRGRK